MSKHDGLDSQTLHTCAGLDDDGQINELVHQARDLELRVCVAAQEEVRRARVSKDEAMYRVVRGIVPAYWAWQVTHAYGGEAHFTITRYLGS